MIRILFVCMGNICRSPLAEAVFRQQVRERGVDRWFEIDSAGTSGYHEGDPPDSRTVSAARRRNLVVDGASRPVSAHDLQYQDLVIVMDSENLAFVERLHTSNGGDARIHRLREWDPKGDSLDVPDPYYGGERGFDNVHDIVERSCEALLEALLAELPVHG